jgi:hypothetical protein
MLRYTCMTYLALLLSLEGLLSLWLSLSVSTDMTFMEAIAMGQDIIPHPATANRVTPIIVPSTSSTNEGAMTFVPVKCYDPLKPSGYLKISYLPFCL